MTKRLKYLLICALSLCLAACALCVSACGGGKDNGGGTKGDSAANPIVVAAGDHTASVAEGKTVYYEIDGAADAAGGEYTVSTTRANGLIAGGGSSGFSIKVDKPETGRAAFSVTTRDKKAADIAFKIEYGEKGGEEGDSADNPIKAQTGENVAHVAAGKSVYFEYSTRNDESDDEFVISTADANGVIVGGDKSGASVTLKPDDNKIAFSVRTADGKAGDIKFEITVKAAPGTERNPYPATVYDGTPETQFNDIAFENAKDTVSYGFTAAETGFYVVTSECAYLQISDGTGMQPSGGFKIVYYVKQGGSATVSFTLSDSYKGDVATDTSLKFTVARDTEHGAGTQVDPYKITAGAMCKLLIDEQDAATYFKAVDGAGNGVAATVRSLNISAEFTEEVVEGAVASGAVFGVMYGNGRPTFIVE